MFAKLSAALYQLPAATKESKQVQNTANWIEFFFVWCAHKCVLDFSLSVATLWYAFALGGMCLKVLNLTGESLLCIEEFFAFNLAIVKWLMDNFSFMQNRANWIVFVLILSQLACYVWTWDRYYKWRIRVMLDLISALVCI